MDIRILDSHLREFLKTDATEQDIAREVSLRSASVEKVEKLQDDIAYELEVTTNRPDMACVMGIAKETAASLTAAGIKASYHEEKLRDLTTAVKMKQLNVTNDPKLVRRICAVLMTATQKESPDFIKKRLEAAGIRPLNNLIDITNYVMLETGHPTHAFDFDRLNTKQMTIRESKKGEKITTLDEKEHILPGGDIIIEDENGRIVDLVGIMGLLNSSITDNTTRVLFWVDNNEPWHIRKSSMSMAIRTDAAALNEKGIDPELAMKALQKGIALYEKYAEGEIIDAILDLYSHRVSPKTVEVSFEQINNLIGINVDYTKAKQYLELLDFGVKETKTSFHVTVPTSRIDDVTQEADVIEEIARLIGYHTLPNILPPYTHHQPYIQGKNIFFWEKRVREALKYWGFTETYTYSMVSESLIDTTKQYYKVQNPLDNEHVFLRQSLMPSLIEVTEINKSYDNLKLFELAKVYQYQKRDLPHEREMLGILLQGERENFVHMKGIIEQLLGDMQIEITWDKPKREEDKLIIPISIQNNILGNILLYSNALVLAELDFDMIATHASLAQQYTEPSAFPVVEEDMTFVLDEAIPTGAISEIIQKQSNLITSVQLVNRYQDARTFHIVYQSTQKNLASEDITPIREKIVAHLEKSFGARVK